MRENVDIKNLNVNLSKISHQPIFVKSHCLGCFCAITLLGFTLFVKLCLENVDRLLAAQGAALVLAKSITDYYSFSMLEQ